MPDTKTVLTLSICYLSLLIVAANLTIGVWEFREYITHCVNNTISPPPNTKECDFEYIFAMVMFSTIPVFIIISCVTFFCCLNDDNNH